MSILQSSGVEIPAQIYHFDFSQKLRYSGRDSNQCCRKPAEALG